MGKRWKAIGKSRSWRPGTVEIIGQPLFDTTLESSRRQPSRQPEPGSRIRVLYLGTDFLTGVGDWRSHKQQLADIRLLHDLLRRSLQDRFELSVRPHPMERSAYFRELNDLAEQVDVDASSALDQAILPSDLVVSNISSASLAAVLARRPCLVFGPNLARSRFRRLLQNFPCQPATPETLPSFMERLFVPADRTAWIEGNVALAAEYVHVDPRHRAAELAGRLLEKAAAAAPRLARQSQP